MGRIDFESRYEKDLAVKAKNSKRIKELLPIKTNGSLKAQVVEEEAEEDIEEDPNVPVDILDEIFENQDGNDEEEKVEVPEEKVHKVYSTAILLASRRQKLLEYKVKMGILSSTFLEDPENRLKNLDSLLTMLDIVDPAIALTVPKFAAVSLQAVFADVLPSYAIQHHNADGVKLKSDTRERQGYEAQLLKRYKMFLQKLERIVGKYISRRKPKSYPPEAEMKLGRVALDCMCRMLLTHPYFNLSVNIVNFVVPFLNNWCQEVRKSVVNTLKTVFRNDKRGELSYEIVRRINTLVKAHMSKGRSGNIRREVLDVLLGLRIKEADLEKEKVEDMKPNGKMTFEQRRMLSKRQRKKAKDLVKLEQELLEASAEENKQRKSKFLTDITKLVFTLYFRALKTNPKPQMLTAVLEGLAKFAHIINISYFGDLLHVLEGLLTTDGIQEHQKLLCIATVLTVLSGQGSALTIDPAVFHRHLYGALWNLRCGVLSSDADVALRCCQFAMKRNKMPAPRAVAFAKRISTVATQVEYNDALGLLIQLKHVLRDHPTCAGLLDTDGANASGIYKAELDDPDHCSAQATNLWEMSVLLFHYHPWVRQIARSIVDPDKIEPVPQEIGQKRPEDVCSDLNPYPDMEFRPAPPRKNGPPPAKRARINQYRPKLEYFTQDKHYFDQFTAQDHSSLDKVEFL